MNPRMNRFALTTQWCLRLPKAACVRTIRTTKWKGTRRWNSTTKGTLWSSMWGLLRLNDRKSRHRRIKKQRCYERLAATSQLSPFCFAPWKHDKTQDKNWGASTRAMKDSNLYISEKHLDCSPKPDASSRRRLAPCSRRGGLANLHNGCGRLGRPRKFLPRGDRILPQAASSRASLHRTRFPASFLWWGMACRAWAGHRQKFLPRRSRILGLEAFQETCLHRTHFPASFLWWRMACKAWAGHRQKLPTAA